MTKKPIFKRFTGDKKLAQRYMPKARSMIRELEERPFDAGLPVRINRRQFGAKEEQATLTIYEHATHFVAHIDAVQKEQKEGGRGGVWLIPYDDANSAGYDGGGNPVAPKTLVDDEGKSYYNPLGSWAHHSLEPKKSTRGDFGPQEAGIQPTTADEPVDPTYAYYVVSDHGVGRRNTTFSYHEPSDSYLSWELGWDNIGYIGFSISEVENRGINRTYSNRYFHNPAGQYLTWNGHSLGQVPTEGAHNDFRAILGANLLGGDTGSLTVLLTTIEYSSNLNYTYGAWTNEVRTPIVKVWSRSFPGNLEPKYKFPDNSIATEENPAGWNLIGTLEVPAKWDFHTRQEYTTGHFGQPHRSYYYVWPRVHGVAAFNEEPVRDPETNEILYYEISGPWHMNAIHEWDLGDPVARPPDYSEDPVVTEYSFCGTQVTGAFWHLKISPDLLGIVEQEWEAVIHDIDETITPASESPLSEGYHTILRGINPGDGWVKAAIDYRGGERVYLEGRGFVDDDYYTGSQEFTAAFNSVSQIRWNGHSFTGQRTEYFDTPSNPLINLDQFDADYNHFVIQGIDLRYDRAWVTSYFVEKRWHWTGTEFDYLDVFTQKASNFLIVGKDILREGQTPEDLDIPNNTIIHMWDEFDGGQPLLTPYNLNGDDPGTPSSPINTLRDACSSYETTQWYLQNQELIWPMSMDLCWNGHDGSTRDKNIEGFSYRAGYQTDADKLVSACIGFSCTHEGNVILGKKRQQFGFSTFRNLQPIYGIQWDISGEKAIVWDTLNFDTAYVDTYNMPSNDSDCDWLGMI